MADPSLMVELLEVVFPESVVKIIFAFYYRCYFSVGGKIFRDGLLEMDIILPVKL